MEGQVGARYTVLLEAILRLPRVLLSIEGRLGFFDHRDLYRVVH